MGIRELNRVLLVTVLPLLCAVPGAAAAAARPAAALRTPDQVWDRLARCESGGDWQADTGNGYYGGLQIWPPTWEEADGLRFAARPDLATRREQITVGEEILRQQGWEAWGGCAVSLGLLRPDTPAPAPAVEPVPAPAVGGSIGGAIESGAPGGRDWATGFDVRDWSGGPQD
ncbi:transglycosylase family protein [Kitasatospora sp. NPDC049258]|uniref:transglycosylase family protein n=1 Tax=Kitasatospora sp. NPDC049258 TaxID=3155394 RepID=UPI00342BD39C